MTGKKPGLSRRTVLRGMAAGAGVSLALPRLEAMLNGNGTAYADGTAIPKRFGVFFWANGRTWLHGGMPDRWTPAATGTGDQWQLSELLQPLAANKAYLNVVTGLQPTTDIPKTPGGQEDGHMRGAAVTLTGDHPRSAGFHHPSHTFAFNRATIDQHVATHPDFYGSSPTRFKSLEIGVSRVRFHGYGHWNAISHRGPDMLNLPILGTGDLFNHLFGVAPDTSVIQARSSVLDAVSEDAKALSKRLGQRDRQRVEAHLTHVGEIQRRLNAGAAICNQPAGTGNIHEGNDDLHLKLSAMCDLLCVALQCDLTRVFSVMFTSPATNHIIAHAGATASMHQHCHDGAYEIVRKATFYHMQALNILLLKMQATEDVQGNLLDNSVVYATSEYGEGYHHGVGNFPVILAGKAGGALKVNNHVNRPGQSLSRAQIDALRALGIRQDSFGWNGGTVTDGVGLLA